MSEVQARFNEIPFRESAIGLFIIGTIASAVTNPSASIVAIVVWTLSVPILISVLAYNSILRASLKNNILLVVWGLVSIVISVLLSYGWQSMNPQFDQHTFLQIVQMNIQTTRLINGGLNFIFTTATLTAHYVIVASLVKRSKNKFVYALLLLAPLTVFISSLIFIFIR